MWEYMSSKDTQKVHKQTCIRMLQIGSQLDSQQCNECDGYGHKDGACGYRKRLYKALGVAGSAQAIFSNAHSTVRARRSNIGKRRRDKMVKVFSWDQVPS